MIIKNFHIAIFSFLCISMSSMDSDKLTHAGYLSNDTIELRFINHSDTQVQFKLNTYSLKFWDSKNEELNAIEIDSVKLNDNRSVHNFVDSFDSVSFMVVSCGPDPTSKVIHYYKSNKEFKINSKDSLCYLFAINKKALRKAKKLNSLSYWYQLGGEHIHKSIQLNK